ncbi:UdgX family uracil-DNA binding protein [Verrucomicrobium spinosum]|uniref:UdgX family uracil-DNA binding protein n=1 Tax=Verrucomicrobium spinosum TaxID=2736 RepID=UPI0001745AC7|nr:UdgX family uracil-DNA binding protein [Verrucomicrobium spinosum]
MHLLTLEPSFAAWHRVARRALQAEWAWDTVLWEDASDSQLALGLLDETPASVAQAAVSAPTYSVPKAFMDMARTVACHRSAHRWSLLYRVLWRITHGEHHLLKVAVDPDVHELHTMEKSVRRDVHKMRAFVRFREVVHEGQVLYVAWFEPQHHILELNAPFFIDRFAGMQWSILTPERCLHWDGVKATYTPGVSRHEAPTGDAMESLWLQYYAHIFNPARVKTHAMLAEMPMKYWRNLPEAAIIPTLLEQASPRVEVMMERSHALQSQLKEAHPADVPNTNDLEVLRDAAATCKACPLYKDATQTVFGEGHVSAEIVFLGEQPGDQEDLAGKPFVGPAGRLLDQALQEAGIDRETCYVTNAVKHFKWKRQGKRRLHQTPVQAEIHACKPWWRAELAIIKPRILVCLGATAARTVLEHAVKIGDVRGEFMETTWCEKTLVTVHPSSLLRQPDPEIRAEEMARFVADLKLVARALASR